MFNVMTTRWCKLSCKLSLVRMRRPLQISTVGNVLLRLALIQARHPLLPVQVERATFRKHEQVRRLCSCECNAPCHWKTANGCQYADDDPVWAGTVMIT